MLSDPLTLLFLLLPIAAISGYFVGMRQRKPQEREINLNQDYFKGINYLLNERPDKAIEVFLRLTEVDNETVETHLALGALFRQRGEVERALRIHQNLIARPNLSQEHRRQAVFELATDYMRTGIMDRAEKLFHELLDGTSHATSSMRQLITIFEQEKEWQNAIEMSRNLEKASGKRLNVVVAHYYCELAEESRAAGDLSAAREYLRLAIQEDPDCARASIMQGNVHFESKSYYEAIRFYRRALEDEPSFASELIGNIVTCYKHLQREDDLPELLEHLAGSSRDVRVYLILMQLLHERKEPDQVKRVLQQYLSDVPGLFGVSEILGWVNSEPPWKRSVDLEELIETIPDVLGEAHRYQCVECGFACKNLHWQCPTCKSWSSVHPIKAVSVGR